MTTKEEEGKLCFVSVSVRSTCRPVTNGNGGAARYQPAVDCACATRHWGCKREKRLLFVVMRATWRNSLTLIVLIIISSSNRRNASSAGCFIAKAYRFQQLQQQDENRDNSWLIWPKPLDAYGKPGRLGRKTAKHGFTVLAVFKCN